MSGRGGRREGAGRPLTGGVPRKQHQLRTTDEEWDLIREFSHLVKQDIGKARDLLEKQRDE